MQSTRQNVSFRTTASYVHLGPYLRILGSRPGWVVASAVVALFFALSLIVDSRRLLWYDEISTVLISGMPSLSAIWHAMHRPLDASTPTYFFLERAFYSGLHHTRLAARLSSTIAVCAGLVAVFHFVARVAGSLYALIALGVLTCSFLPYYSYEARSYSIYFLLSACALWVWLRFDVTNWRSAVLFGACFFAGELMHYYFVFCLVPYLAFELLHWGKIEKRTKALAAAIIGVALAGLILLRPALAVRELAKGFWSPVGLSSVNSFSRFFPYCMAPLAFCALWVVLASDGRDKPSRIAPMSSVEELGWLFLLIPLAGIVVGKFITHAFVERYFIGFLPGVALGVACCCSRFLRSFSVAAGVALILLAFGLGQQALYAVNPDLVHPADQSQTVIEAIIASEPRILRDGKKFIVVPESLMFLEARNFSSHPELYPYLPQLNMTERERTNATTLTNMGRLGWLNLWTIDQLLDNAPNIALIGPYEGLVRLLNQKGYKLVCKALNPVPIYYVEKD